MYEKTKMYTTIIVTWITTTVLLSWIMFSDIRFENISQWAWGETVVSQMSDQELKEFLTWAQRKEFTNTEWSGSSEMLVNQELIAYMPKIEQEYTKSELEALNIDSWTSEETRLPKEVNLDVTFFPQAPDANWSLPWKEACEEASLIQAYYYVMGKELSKDTFRSEILWIVDLQQDILGKYIDTSMTETAKFLEEHYDYTDYQIIDNPSIDDMKRELAQGHPIIAPFAGKELWNSFFTNGWPRYHVLVIVWYNESFFLTNDVGTSRGENFAYSYETIMDAMHDLVPNGEGDILDGEKRILVLQ